MDDIFQYAHDIITWNPGALTIITQHHLPIPGMKILCETHMSVLNILAPQTKPTTVIKNTTTYYIWTKTTEDPTRDKVIQNYINLRASNNKNSDMTIPSHILSKLTPLLFPLIPVALQTAILTPETDLTTAIALRAGVIPDTILQQLTKKGLASKFIPTVYKQIQAICIQSSYAQWSYRNKALYPDTDIKHNQNPSKQLRRKQTKTPSNRQHKEQPLTKKRKTWEHQRNVITSRQKYWSNIIQLDHPQDPPQPTNPSSVTIMPSTKTDKIPPPSRTTQTRDHNVSSSILKRRRERDEDTTGVPSTTVQPRPPTLAPNKRKKPTINTVRKRRRTTRSTPRNSQNPGEKRKRHHTLSQHLKQPIHHKHQKITNFFIPLSTHPPTPNAPT